MTFRPSREGVHFHVSYETLGDNPLYGKLFDPHFLTSNRFHFISRTKKMVYTIPYFQDQLTGRLNRNVRAEFVFTPEGWHSIMTYMKRNRIPI